MIQQRVSLVAPYGELDAQNLTALHSRQGWKGSFTNPGMPGNFMYIQVQTIEFMIRMMMTTNKEQEALTTARHEPCVDEKSKEVTTQNPWITSPMLYEDKAQGSKIQSRD